MNNNVTAATAEHQPAENPAQIGVDMTIDQAIAFADEWSEGMTFFAGSQGWRVVCRLLADEVRRQRGSAKVLDELLTYRLRRHVRVEQQLLDIANEKSPLPDRQTCRDIAMALGVPTPEWAAIEILNWARDGSLPDDDELVLIEEAGTGDVLAGYHDGDQWHAIDGMPINADVVAWATWPAGSKGGAA